MNCKKAERRIYLYDMLAPREREETDRHIATCATCQQLSARVNDERQSLKTMLQSAPAFPEPQRFTQRIMDEVEKRQQKKVSASSFLAAFIFSPPVRYGMAALSVLLVVAFMAEQKTQPVSQNSFRVDAAITIKMNSASFYEALRERKKDSETTSSVYECVMACLQTHDSACSKCRVKFANLIRNHETI